MAIVKGMIFGLISSSASLMVFDTVNNNMTSPITGVPPTLSVAANYEVITTKDLAFMIHGRTTTPFISVIDAETGNYVTPYSANPGAAVQALAISPDGSRIACGLTGGNFIIYYTYPGWVWSVGPNPGAAVSDIAFSPDGTKLAVALGASPWAKVYDVATGSDITPAWATAPSGAINGIAWSPDGARLALTGTTTGGNALRVYNATTGAVLFSATTFTGRRCAFSPNGTILAVATNGTGNSGLRFWTVPAGTEVTRTKTTIAQGTTRHVRWIDDDYMMAFCANCAFIYRYSTQTVVNFAVNHYTTDYGAGFVEGAAVRKLAGTVVNDSNVPVERRVVVFDARTGIRLGETMSNATTGAFEIVIFSPDFVNVVAYGITGENCRVFGPVTPVAL
jgi:WD40 repeat protein